MNQVWLLWILLIALGIAVGLAIGYYLLGLVMNTRWGRVRLSGLLNWYEKPIPEDMEVLLKNGRWIQKERPKQP